MQAMPLQTGPLIPCPKCQTVLSETVTYFEQFFSGDAVKCPYPKCGTSLNWWDVVVDQIKETNPLVNPVNAIGLKHVFTEIELRPDAISTIRFRDIGVPETANIISVQYTTIATFDANLRALEMINPVFRHQVPQVEVSFYPAKLKHDQPSATVKVSLSVSWIEHSPDDELWQSVIDSLLHLHRGYETAAIIPANVAVEAKLARLMTKAFSRTGCSKENIQNCLTDGATYSHQLNVILPLLIKKTGARELSDDIRGQLNYLRKLRNQIAHQGKLESKLNRADLAAPLAASIFGFHYLGHVEPIIMASL